MPCIRHQTVTQPRPGRQDEPASRRRVPGCGAANRATEPAGIPPGVFPQRIHAMSPGERRKSGCSPFFPQENVNRPASVFDDENRMRLGRAGENDALTKNMGPDGTRDIQTVLPD